MREFLTKSTVLNLNLFFHPPQSRAPAPRRGYRSRCEGSPDEIYCPAGGGPPPRFMSMKGWGVRRSTPIFIEIKGSPSEIRLKPPDPFFRMEMYLNHFHGGVYPAKVFCRCRTQGAARRERGRMRGISRRNLLSPGGSPPPRFMSVKGWGSAGPPLSSSRSRVSIGNHIETTGPLFSHGDWPLPHRSLP